MQPRCRSGRKLRVAGTLTTGLAFSLASCGTLLYPERRDQPAGRLDVGVVALDGLGLLLFLVPGVIAFAVDFATGAIYLPPGYASLAPPAAKDLRQVRVAPAELTPRRVEAIVLEQTGKAVSLEPRTGRCDCRSSTTSRRKPWPNCNPTRGRTGSSSAQAGSNRAGQGWRETKAITRTMGGTEADGG